MVSVDTDLSPGCYFAKEPPARSRILIPPVDSTRETPPQFAMANRSAMRGHPMDTKEPLPTNPATSGENSNPDHPSSLSRRQFMAAGAAVTGFTVVPRHVLGGVGYVPPSEKITLACIGFGTQAIREIGGIL